MQSEGVLYMYVSERVLCMYVSQREKHYYVCIFQREYCVCMFQRETQEPIMYVCLYIYIYIYIASQMIDIEHPSLILEDCIFICA